MENASKALLIAGAILIVIVLISVGMLIVNSTQDVTSEAEQTAASQANDTFNRQFTQFEGKQKGSTCKSLKTAVESSNGAHDTDHKVTLSLEAEDGNWGSVSNTKTYTVTINYTNGLVSTITISE